MTEVIKWFMVSVSVAVCIGFFAWCTVENKKSIMGYRTSCLEKGGELDWSDDCEVPKSK